MNSANPLIGASSSFDQREELQKSDSSSDGKRMEIDPSEEGYVEKKTAQEMREKSLVEVDSNEHAQTFTIDDLPEEILSKILKFLLPVLGEGKWNAHAFVSKKWKRFFDGNLLNCLQKGDFPRASDRHILISSLVKDKETLDKIHKALGKYWIYLMISKCRDESEASFILANIWLTPLPIDSSLLANHYPKIVDLLKTLMKLNTTDYLPNKDLCFVIQGAKLPEKTLKEAVRLGYLSSLILIPEDQRTLKICLTAVQKNGNDLRYVPEELRISEIYLAAVQNGYALQKVPKNMKTNAICWAAVQRDGLALEFVPENLRTTGICMIAMGQNRRAFKFVPEQIKMRLNCLAFVQQEGCMLEYVPEKLKTLEMCLSAVQQQGLALRYVPENLKTTEICGAAVQQNGLALQDVPENKRTPEICLAAVQKDGNSLKYVPVNLRTLEMCLLAGKHWNIS
jgi:hypothetical protein